MSGAVREKFSAKKAAVRLVSLLLVFGWMFVISGFSAQNGEESAGLSMEVSYTVVEQYNTITNAQMDNNEVYEQAREIELPVRKLAHMAEYFILAGLMTFAMWAFGLGAGFFFLVVPLCFAYAAADEFHQTLVDGRAGQFRDVLIDTSGALAAMILVGAVSCIINQIKKRKR